MIEFNQRGFAVLNFEDRYGQKCSLQKSSAAMYEAVWLGVDTDLNGAAVNARMHLTRDQVQELLPHLKRFVETGELHYVYNNGHPVAFVGPPRNRAERRAKRQ